MKKLILLATAAAFVMPSAAHADFFKKDRRESEANREQTYTYKKVETTDAERNAYRIEMQTEDNFRSTSRQRTFNLVDGQKLQIDGNAVYKTTANGSRFYAPNGSYEANNGQTVVVEDGLLIRIEDRPEIVAMETYDSRRR